MYLASFYWEADQIKSYISSQNSAYDAPLFKHGIVDRFRVS